MTEYIIEVGKIQFYLFSSYFEPEGYIVDTVITVDLSGGGEITMEFEDEVRILEKETRKVIFNSEDEIWESYR